MPQSVEEFRRKAAAYSFRRRRQRIEAGLCVDCKEPAAPERTRCRKHLAAGYAHTAAYRRRMQAKAAAAADTAADAAGGDP